jgi:hypothetical protein
VATASSPTPAQHWVPSVGAVDDRKRSFSDVSNVFNFFILRMFFVGWLAEIPFRSIGAQTAIVKVGCDGTTIVDATSECICYMVLFVFLVSAVARSYVVVRASTGLIVSMEELVSVLLINETEKGIFCRYRRITPKSFSLGC